MTYYFENSNVTSAETFIGSISHMQNDKKKKPTIQHHITCIYNLTAFIEHNCALKQHFRVVLKAACKSRS